MHERNTASYEQEPRQEDAAQLAKLLYFTYIRQVATGEHEVGEVADEEIGSYLEFRVRQDPEMGQILVNAFESYRDPDLGMEKLEALRGMQEQANRIRESLGLPERELPTEIPPPLAEP